MNIQIKKFYEYETTGGSIDWYKEYCRVNKELNELKKQKSEEQNNEVVTLKKQLSEERAGRAMFQEGVLELNRKILEKQNNDAIEFAWWIHSNYSEVRGRKHGWMKRNIDGDILSAKELYQLFKSESQPK